VNGVKVIDRGWNKILKRVQAHAASGAHVVVGIPKGNNKTYQGTQVGIAEVAAWNHWGTSQIPARPFISGPVKANEMRIRALQARLMKGFVEGKISEKVALTLLGTEVLNLILTAINSGFPPPNAPSTIKNKKSSQPLIDTGQLKGALTMELRGGKYEDERARAAEKRI
jgi:hypothetical protein